MRFFTIFLYTAIFLFSCSSNNNDTLYSSINLGDAVLVKPIIFKTNKLHAEIYDIRIIDSVLLLKSHDGRGCLQLFDKLNFEFLKTNGIIGRGPGEFVDDGLKIKIINDSLHVLQLRKNIVSIYNTNSFLNDSLPIAQRIIKLEKYNGNFDFFPIDGYFVSRPTIKNRFATYNYTGQHLGDFSEYPCLGDNTDQRTTDLAFRFYTLTEPKPDLSKFVSLTFLGGILEIFNIKDGSINKLIEKRYLDPNLQNGQDPGSIMTDNTNMGFYGVSATEKFIYASYSGLKRKKYHDNNKLLDYITVFDWNGNLKKVYKVEGGLFTLAVDEALNRIYIVTKNLEEGKEIVGYFNM